jgi:hypothetical protein
LLATGTEASSVSGPVSLLSAVAGVLEEPVAPPPLKSISPLRDRVGCRVAPGLADLEQGHRCHRHVGTAHDRTGIRIRIGHATPVRVVLPVFWTVIV